jgi:hypothetical protein
MWRGLAERSLEEDVDDIEKMCRRRTKDTIEAVAGG